MKTKGTSLWEQYIEYVALVVAIALLGWFAWGAFGSKIEHRQGKIVVQAGTVDDELLKAASALENKLKDGTQSPLAITAPEALYDKYSRQLNQSVSPKDRVVFPTVDLTAELDTNQDVQSELREYVSPVIPEPLNMKTRQWHGTIAQSAIAETEELRESIEGPPHDTMWVQVAGTIDIDAILESYAATDGYSAIPQQWYDEAIDIFDVEIQRQQKIDDEWSSPEVISTLPGHLSYRTQLDEGTIDAIERDEIIRQLRTGKQDDIVTPSFYTLKGYRPKELEDPSVWSGDIEIEESPLQILQNQLKKVEEKIQKQEDDIVEINQDIKDAGTGSGGGIGGGGRGGGGGGSSGSSDLKIERLQRKLVRAQATLAKLIEGKDAIEEAIEELKASSILEEGETVMSGEVWVWGHDMSVVPGETYRYRMLVQLANPFFGHKPSLYQRQHSLANLVVIASKQSDWSDPIRVQESKQWFVKQAKSVDVLSSNDIQNRGYISIDIFEFSDGQWTKKSRDIRVGQPLAAEGIGESLGWFVLDVIEDVHGEIALLQNMETRQILTKRPDLEIQNVQFHQLLRQIREQSSAGADTDDSDDSGSPTDPPVGPPGGGRGGGGGGIGGGGRR